MHACTGCDFCEALVKGFGLVILEVLCSLMEQIEKLHYSLNNPTTVAVCFSFCHGATTSEYK